MGSYLVTVRVIGTFETCVRVDAPDEAQAQDVAALTATDPSHQAWHVLKQRGMPDTEQVERIG
jgi:hypothetical protein